MSSARYGDEELALRRLLAGEWDEATARTVDERLVPRLAGFLRRRFPSLVPEDADDLARESLAVALERRVRFDAGRAEATTWLHGNAKLRAAEHFRKRGREQPLAEDWSGDDDGEPGARRRHAAAIRRATSRLFPAASGSSPLAERVREAIFRLPEQQRRAAEAHYLEGLPPREVDDAYGWRPNTANVYLSHARRAVRRHLDGPVATAGGCRTLARRRLAVRHGPRVPVLIAA
jgi:DNA-directed RNA polymerase specialized sigma24 family protein